MSSFLTTLKEVNQRGSERQSGNPKSSSPSLAGPGGAHTPQRSGLVEFYMTSCGRLTGAPRSYYQPWKETPTSHGQ